MILNRTTSTLLALFLTSGGAAYAQAAGQAQSLKPAVTEGATKASTGGPAPLVVLFESGSSVLRSQDKVVLDRAARAYNEGKPIVMVLTGTSDRVGAAEANLTLSQRRATAVLTGLLDRGIPADRFQVVAKGQTELPVPTPQGVAELKNRSVAISWH